MLTILSFGVGHWFFRLPFGFATLPSRHQPRRQVVSPITDYRLPITYYLLPAYATV
ncbi:hypothetical protein [Fischerella thermalis]|uniref:hypothetical protein n=1 Tax=Fischerella thermalis TaxID=372787 RepID=UPI00307EF123